MSNVGLRGDRTFLHGESGEHDTELTARTGVHKDAVPAGRMPEYLLSAFSVSYFSQQMERGRAGPSALLSHCETVVTRDSF